ncbi:cytochrome-c oxidase, cbb3-type subunit I [Aeoliella sp.]|uniref:cytochrome-c oxidase, cbb3-type subunit I n=1 Tax=Aeoliella sp. TaxID=2795800 RepID=UPI003CCBDA1F
MQEATAPHGADRSSAGPLESFSYDDAIVRKFVTATLVWAVVGFLVGIILAAELPFPKLNGGLEWITFGRLRPLHTNAVIFAFAGNAIFAAIYYSTQRLCKARMWNDTLSNLHFWGWQLIIVSAALTLPFGITQSKEYAELEWPIDIAIAVVWAGFFGVNFFMTLVTRRERHMYVALWFYIATIVTVAVLHIFNNIWVPLVAMGNPGTVLGWFKSYPIYAGAQDAMMQWWYGHNAVAFFLTTPFLGLMYYFLPKAANRPIFSYRLSILHFWSLVFIYIWAGPHHLHYSPTAEWAQTLGMVFSVMLWMPSWGGMINGLLTLRGVWHKVTTDPVLKFFVVGITFYGMSTFEGPLLSIKSVNALSHYTDWTIGHVHAGALGWNGFMAFGMIYWLAPRLYQTNLHSVQYANLHFWLGTAGILVYVVSMYVAGLTQGLMWRGINDMGQLAYPEFVQTTQAIIVFYHIRLLGGLLFLAGTLIGCWNIYLTWSKRPAKYDVPVYEAPALRDEPFTPEQRPESDLVAVLEVGKTIDTWSTLWWHRVWERLPIKFTLMTTLAVVLASVLELVPTFVMRSNIPADERPVPYSPLELAGRDIYVAEGCYNCHSQMIRPMVAETARYLPPYSKPADSMYDHPFQWGSRRIGPDLAHEGGLRGNDWHVQHFHDPQAMTQGSIMPPYPWLMKKKIDFDSIPLRIAAMQALDVPYPQYEGDARSQAAEDAREQAADIARSFQQQNGGPYRDANANEIDLKDRQVVALIAYLQRLGADPAPADSAGDSPDAPEEGTDGEGDGEQDAGEQVAQSAGEKEAA